MSGSVAASGGAAAGLLQPAALTSGLARSSPSELLCKLTGNQGLPTGLQLFEPPLGDLQQHGGTASVEPGGDQALQDDSLRDPELLSLGDQDVDVRDRSVPGMTWRVHSFASSTEVEDMPVSAGMLG